MTTRSSSAEAAAVETSIEPILAWRCWRLIREPWGGLRLLPAGLGSGAWPPRQAFEAKCRSRMGYPSHPPKHGTHRSPDPDCSCGIYAMPSMEDLGPGFGTPLVGAIGTISMWGRVIEHERGWRAEFAYPQRVRLVCVGCLEQGGGEVVPAVIVRGPEGDGGLLGLCQTHRAQVDDRHLHEEGAASIQAQVLDTYAVDLLPMEQLGPIRTRRGGVGEGQWRGLVSSVRRQPPLAWTPRPVVTPAPAPAPASAPAPVRVRPPKPPLHRRIGQALTTVLVWGLIGTCALRSMIVTVPASTPSSPPSMISPAFAPPVVSDPVGSERIGHTIHTGHVDVRMLTICAQIVDARVTRYVGCGSSKASAIGFAQSPPMPCQDEDTAVTQRPDFSICWFSFDEIPPRLWAPDPFR